MKKLVFYSAKNTNGKNDAIGAFIPESEEFAKLHRIDDCDRYGINCSGIKEATRRENLLTVLRSQNENSIEAIAFFCHGWSKGIQFGIGMKQIEELCRVFSVVCREDVKIVLYACWAADADGIADTGAVGPGTDGGFADKLRDGMLRVGLGGGWVDAHKKEGHTTKNPMLVRFDVDPVADEDGDFDLPGGYWIVQPRSPLWGRWRRALAETDLKYRFPFMTETEIREALIESSE